MNWNPHIAKPLLKRLLFAAIMLPPLAALTSTSTPAPQKAAAVKKDTIRIFRKTPSPARQPASVQKDSGSLFDRRCTGI